MLNDPILNVPLLPVIPYDSLSGFYLVQCRTDLLFISSIRNASITKKVEIVAKRIFVMLFLNFLTILDLARWVIKPTILEIGMPRHVLNLISFVTLPILSIA